VHDGISGLDRQLRIDRYGPDQFTFPAGEQLAKPLLRAWLARLPPLFPCPARPQMTAGGGAAAAGSDRQPSKPVFKPDSLRRAIVAI
jgi:hypothetical protein